ncbi:putative deacetylvindoline O-acetyltransferase [Helianthus annuus]|nr:putative deacetylvindoline O-acetyltransferase [Helianthus annuus]
MTMIGKILLFQRRKLHTIISREMIKPLSPTPSLHHTYNLSQVDLCSTHVYMPLIFYYPNNEICSLTPNDKAHKIKKSLSQSLTRCYPFAGKLHTPTAPYIDCNDEGVVFVEARNDSHMNMSQHINDDTVGQLFVDGMFWQMSPPHRATLVGVKLNHFACGGMALGVSMSHRIGDGSTLGSFVSHWASVARYGSTDHEQVLPFNPQFLQSPPATTNFLPHPFLDLNLRCVNPVTRKFVFPNTKLSDLKNKVVLPSTNGGSITNPTRVEVLTSLLYKTAVAAATTARSSSSSSKPHFLLIPCNIRKKFVPKLPQTTVGNFIAGFIVMTRHESETSLSALVSAIRKQKMKVETIQSQELARQNLDSMMSRLGNEDLENVAHRFFCCSSLCGLGFNNVNFGWGNPAVASTTYMFSKQSGFILMDTPNGDGIEAWVSLERQDMKIFQNDKELLSFCQN